MISESLQAALSYLSEPVQAAILTIANDAAARAGRDVAGRPTGYISAATIAGENQLNIRVVRRHLARWRAENDAWLESANPEVGGDVFVYVAHAVAPLIETMKHEAAVRRSVRGK